MSTRRSLPLRPGLVFLTFVFMLVMVRVPCAQITDSDLDGLSDLDEYSHGTNPYDSDSDDGGENDGSEVDSNQDPLDPSDDQIEEVDCVAASPSDSAVILVFHAALEHVRMRLYRKAGAMRPYALHDDNVVPDGEYEDTGLNNGILYRYRMLAVDAEKHWSAVTEAVSASPGAHHVFRDGFECRALAWSNVVP